jgi:hypothetical protein
MRKTISRVAVVVAAAVLTLGFSSGAANAYDISWGLHSAPVSSGK